MNDKIRGMLGLAAKAGFIVSGEFSVEQALKKGRAYLVIIAGDASANTKKHFTDMCRYRDVPVAELYSRDILGHCTGKGERASLGITDSAFAQKLISMIQEG